MTVKQVMSLCLLIWNIVVFVTYGLDKGKAQQQSQRISEKTLLGMSYLLGGLGAWAGGYFFRHKTRKWYFRLAWLIGVGLDSLVIYWIWR